MPNMKNHLEEVAAFIREHRSNEANFEKLYAKLTTETDAADADENYRKCLLEVKEKTAEAYKVAKENGGTTWPEFEKFVSGFEKAVMEAINA